MPLYKKYRYLKKIVSQDFLGIKKFQLKFNVILDIFDTREVAVWQNPTSASTHSTAQEGPRGYPLTAEHSATALAFLKHVR